MRFKVKSELDITGIILNVLAMLVGFGILGTIVMLVALTNSTFAILSPLFIIFYSIFVVAFMFLYIVKSIINSIVFGSLKEETNTEKILKEVLEELRELKNNQNKE